jgi:hypothetical protein
MPPPVPGAKRPPAVKSRQQNLRGAQRHLAQWTLSPIAALLSEEGTEKLGTPVTVSGGRVPALLTDGSEKAAKGQNVPARRRSHVGLAIAFGNF